MTFDPTLAAIKFGDGLSPHVAPPTSIDDMLDLLSGADVAAENYPIATYDNITPSRQDFQLANAVVSQAEDDVAEAAAREARSQLQKDAREVWAQSVTAQLARDITTSDGFRERLTRFWADHFTAPATGSRWRHLAYPNIEQTIRPHVAGSFADMLSAAVMSPMLIEYLSQNRSVGPNSRVGQNSERGLNENMAREVLELHTLGVGASYTQTDVREFAELLTGVTMNAQRGSFFRSDFAEPGAETVLGKEYGGEVESLDHVMAALNDLALHPDTARHLSEKLVQHFIGPDPQPDLVAQMARAYALNDGNLLPVYEVLLRHDATWSPVFHKVKQPYGFIASSLRALGVASDHLISMSYRDVRQFIFRPLTIMGQTLHQSPAPDGWPENNDAWITPQGMAGRITWAMQMPQRLLDDLPDPRELVFHALGPTPPDAVVFAANAAETVSDGVGLVLASAAFQRR